MTAVNWQPIPVNLRLLPQDVHVYQLNLDQSWAIAAHYEAVLSADEVEKAYRFRFEHLQRYYMMGRGVLRMILGRYLVIDPAAVQFIYGDHGKPALAPTMGVPTLQFNISHSHSAALLAFTYNREIGVDIEYARKLDDANQIAEHFFSERENMIFRQLPAEQKRLAFFDCWTRKEAFIKAIGEGLSHPLDAFDVAFAPGEEAELLYVANGQATDWSMQALYPSNPDYKAAIVVMGNDWQLACWQWPDDA